MIHSGVGGITGVRRDARRILRRRDHRLQRARPQGSARGWPSATGIEIRYYNIIYNLVDDVKAAMSGLLTPERRETMLGNAQILEIFNVSKVGKIAGCRVTDGKVERGAGVRLIRDNVVDPRRQAAASSSASRTTRARCRPARNAAWPSRTTRTCGRATSSSAIGWRRCSARSESKSQTGAIQHHSVMPRKAGCIQSSQIHADEDVADARH